MTWAERAQHGRKERQTKKGRGGEQEVTLREAEAEGRLLLAVAAGFEGELGEVLDGHRAVVL